MNCKIKAFLRRKRSHFESLKIVLSFLNRFVSSRRRSFTFFCRYLCFVLPNGSLDHPFFNYNRGVVASWCFSCFPTFLSGRFAAQLLIYLTRWPASLHISDFVPYPHWLKSLRGIPRIFLSSFVTTESFIIFLVGIHVSLPHVGTGMMHCVSESSFEFYTQLGSEDGPHITIRCRPQVYSWFDFQLLNIFTVSFPK